MESSSLEREGGMEIEKRKKIQITMVLFYKKWDKIDTSDSETNENENEKAIEKEKATEKEKANEKECAKIKAL